MCEEHMTVKCPFCGKDGEWFEPNCPDVIAIAGDAEEGADFTGEFRILEDIDLKMKNLDADVTDWENSLQGLGVWQHFDCSEAFLVVALEELCHPDILMDGGSFEDSYVSGWTTVFFVSVDKQPKILQEIKALNSRLDELGSFNTETLKATLREQEENLKVTFREKYERDQLDRVERRDREDNFLLVLLQLVKWKNDLLEVRFKDGDSYHVSIDEKRLAISSSETGTKNRWISGLKVEKIIASDPEKRRIFERYPGMNFDPNDVRMITNLATGETITNRDKEDA